MKMLMIIIAVMAIPGILLGSTLPAFWYTMRGGIATAAPRYKASIWRRAAWEFHISILGLFAAGIATIFMTESLKVMVGKPRPDCLARCQPDTNRVADFVVGGIQNAISTGQLVSKAICTGTDHEKINDGFKSFPSGHSSGAAAGLGYLSLFLAGKFGVLSLVTPLTNASTPRSILGSVTAFAKSHRRTASNDEIDRDVSHPAKLRHALASASAPALSLTMIAWIPYAVAMFVAASRWHDYRHHAADILFGFAIGSFFAVIAYRFTQLHLARAVGAPVPQPTLDKEWRPVMAEDEETRLADSTAYRPPTASTYAGVMARPTKET
jgi:membrane-associated phospholipid phosphatase